MLNAVTCAYTAIQAGARRAHGPSASRPASKPHQAHSQKEVNIQNQPPTALIHPADHAESDAGPRTTTAAAALHLRGQHRFLDPDLKDALADELYVVHDPRASLRREASDQIGGATPPPRLVATDAGTVPNGWFTTINHETESDIQRTTTGPPCHVTAAN